jgi:hypothetical protein
MHGQKGVKESRRFPESDRQPSAEPRRAVSHQQKPGHERRQPDDSRMGTSICLQVTHGDGFSDSFSLEKAQSESLTSNGVQGHARITHQGYPVMGDPAGSLERSDGATFPG